jgi:hypothetical protein
VSLAQIQMLGWPCLVSDWGGHRDILGDNIVKVPAAFIGCNQDVDTLVTLRAKHIASLWVRAMDGVSKLKTTKSQPVLSSAQSPDWVDAKQLTDLGLPIEDFPEVEVDSSPLFNEGCIKAIEVRPQGLIFLSKYRHLFSALPLSKFSLVFTNDFNETDNVSTKHIPSVCNVLLDRANRNNDNVSFQLLREAFLPDILFLINEAREIVLPFLTASTLNIAIRILRIAPPQSVFIVIAPQATEDLLWMSLQPHLRMQDKLIKFTNTEDMQAKIYELYQRGLV